MKLIVGLGNPGEKFAYTRHNLGFMVVEKLVKARLPVSSSRSAWKKDEKFAGEVCKMDEVLVIKPKTYMNLSGLAVSRIVNFYKIAPDSIWVIHDDIDLPLGKIRIRKGGASAGHHGIDSIIKTIGTSEFVRFRLGIGQGKLDIVHTADHNLSRQDVEKYVLSPFREDEGGELKKLIKRTVEALEIALDHDIAVAMRQFN